MDGLNERLIRSIPLFASLPESEIRHLAETLRSCEYPPGTLIVEEGRSAERFFILQTGKVEVIKARGTRDERQLAVRRSGTFIGEMGLLSEAGVHTASVQSKTPVRLLEMTQEEFDALLHRNPGLGYDMVRVLSRRLDEAENLTIEDLRKKNRELRQAYRELEAAQDQLIEKERLERELEVARAIQGNILPQSLPTRTGFEFGARIVPMSAVGGDLYDFIPLGANRLGVAVGDVSDHGVPAALFMAITATLLRAEARRSVSPREVLINVNRQLLEMNRSGIFVSVLYGVLDLRNREFVFVRAGHELPTVVGERGEVVPVNKSQGQIMGIFDLPVLEEQAVSLRPGSVLVMHTDGVNEAVDRRGEMFGSERLVGVVGGLRAEPAQAVCDGVLAAVASFRASEPQTDDIAVVALKSI